MTLLFCRGFSLLEVFYVFKIGSPWALDFMVNLYILVGEMKLQTKEILIVNEDSIYIMTFVYFIVVFYGENV